MDSLALERLKSAADIADVVGQYVELHHKGKDLLGLCPFHNDQHLGSFVVSPSRGTYHCFACNAGGDAIDFVQKMEHVSFLQACRMLGAKYGIDVDGTKPAAYVPRRIEPRPKPVEKPALELPLSYVTAKENTQEDTLCNWIRSLPWSDEQRARIGQVLKNYAVGHSWRGHTIFWQIDSSPAVRTGKMMMYRQDGHRDRESHGNFGWVHNMLARAGKVNLDATPYKTCYFGEHLINMLNEDATVCVVESEKTALLCSIYWGMTRDYIWVACGGMTYLTKERLAPFMQRHLYIALYPDHDGMKQWTERMNEVIRQTNYDRLSIQSVFILKYWKESDGQKADVADIIVRQLTHHEDQKAAPEHAKVDNLRLQLDAAFERMKKSNKHFKLLADRLGLEPLSFI